MAPSSHQLKALEDRLNKEETLLQEFVKNPAQILKREGVELTPEQIKHIEEQVSQINLANIPKTAARPRIGISISITIRF
jgi:hypothetical protein